jgi:hypothetical protein
MGRARARTSHDREVVDGAKVGRFAANVLPVGQTLVRIGWLLLALAGGTRAAAAVWRLARWSLRGFRPVLIER